MKLKYLILLVSLCLPLLIQLEARAKTQADGKEIVIDNLPSNDRGVAETIADSLGLGGVFREVVKYLDILDDINNRTLQSNIPDWKTVEEVITNNDTAAKGLSRQLERRDSNSHSINRDEADQIQRELIGDAISNSTTSASAQEISAASLIEVEQVLRKSGNLSQDSADTDVSQQILQNMSEQMGINSQMLGMLSNQGIQAQGDRANQINLALQQSRYLSMEATGRRREKRAISDLGRTAWGIVGTPMFLYEEP
ncbi:MAG: hypothetical protein AAFQ80_07895 [Cyanobacteria bacterium J06621_8]